MKVMNTLKAQLEYITFKNKIQGVIEMKIRMMKYVNTTKCYKEITENVSKELVLETGEENGRYFSNNFTSIDRDTALRIIEQSLTAGYKIVEL